MTLTYAAEANATPDVVWELLARPARWREWAPHVRGAWGLGQPEVEAGRSGLIRLAPALLVPVRVTGKRAGRSWDWKIGPVAIRHRLEPRRERCVVAVDLDAPAPIARLLAVSYGPLVAVLVRNLARVAAGGSGAV